MTTVLNSGPQNKDKAARTAAATKPSLPSAPERATTATRREIRTVLVAAHGWPTDAALKPRRGNRR